MSLVAIVGRPNVGKSTLFNRLVGMRQAIVDDTAGVTRDRHYGRSDWCGREFSVVDTGGYTTNSDDVFESAIRSQVQIAIDEADLIIFMVEAGTGITDYDSEIADVLRRTRKPVVLCVNKVDSGDKVFDSYQFYSLGLGEIYSISAANGSGTGELLDAVVAALPEEKEEADPYAGLPRIAIVGKPNVGKSSLTNALLGEERNIVTPVAGTTRDSIETHYNKFGHEFMLVDTAGIRRKTKVHEDLEFYSVMRSIRAIEHADICILMIDATTGMEAGRPQEQDRALRRRAHHLHFRGEDAAHPERAGRRRAGLCQLQHQDSHGTPQRGAAPDNRRDPAARLEGQIREDQVRNPVAHPFPGLRVLLQPAPVRERPVQALPGEQAAGQLQPHRLPGADLHQAEIVMLQALSTMKEKATTPAVSYIRPESCRLALQEEFTILSLSANGYIDDGVDNGEVWDL